ncbi:hypothetical protein [uncultured Serinicoccus sp.]|uniref:hypothetical protein n=1 Tax=uncultured Serinicoccus sp. TaxID=735514 RepID=UPI002609344C|nr:hypothetical protein [uncultured Serinicoccus sp.]
MTTARTSRTRRPAALVTGALAALALTGCSVNSPQATTFVYAPADGVQMNGEAFDVRDLLLVSQGDGAPAVVSGAVINQTSEPVTVTVSVAGESLSPEVTVDPHSSARLDGGLSASGTEGERVIVPALEGPSGQHVEVRISGDEETLSSTAPVLLPQGPYAVFADDAGGPVEAPEEHSEGDH